MNSELVVVQRLLETTGSGDVLLCGIESPAVIIALFFVAVIWRLLKWSMNKEQGAIQTANTSVSKMAAPVEGESWTCTCGTENPIDKSNCISCHKYRIKKNAWS